MKNKFLHIILVVIAVSLITMAAGHDRRSSNCNSTTVKKVDAADAGDSFNSKYFLTPLSRFY